MVALREWRKAVPAVPYIKEEHRYKRHGEGDLHDGDGANGTEALGSGCMKWSGKFETVESIRPCMHQRP